MTRATTEDTAVPPEGEKLRKIEARVTDDAHAVIRRAIVLRLAMDGEMQADDRELYGRALHHICRDWLAEQARTLGGRNP